MKPASNFHLLAGHGPSAAHLHGQRKTDGRHQAGREATSATHRHTRQNFVSGEDDEQEITTVTNTDPVCRMDVESDSAAATREYQGETYYFCSPGCAQSFDTDPAHYVRQGVTENRSRSDANVEHSHCHEEHHSAKPDHAGHTPAFPAKAYYCPMCPGVESDKPGDCPKCGTRLEPNPAYLASASKTIYTCPMHPEIEQDHPGQCPKCGMTLEPKTVGSADEQEQREVRSLTVKFWVGLL